MDHYSQKLPCPDPATARSVLTPKYLSLQEPVLEQELHQHPELVLVEVVRNAYVRLQPEERILETAVPQSVARRDITSVQCQSVAM